MSDASEGRARGGWYFGGVASWFASSGAQMSLFPYLVAVVLAEDARNLGIAQTSAMLPVMLLMLVGGAAADRTDCRKLLVRLHAVAALPPLALAFLVARGTMTYGAVVAYGVAMGCIAAFVVPARDSLLSRIAGGNVQRAVTVAMGAQTVSQIAGTAVGGAAAALGTPAVLLFQSAAIAAGAFACARLLPAPPVPRAGGRTSAGAEIRAGLREVAQSPRILSTTALAVAIGLFFMGSFIVAVPLLLRDAYGGSSPEIAAVNASMMLGMLTGTGLLFARGGVRRQGRALVASLSIGALLLASLSLAPPLWALYAVIFGFGCGGGVATPTGRTLVQEAASAPQRARVLSVYSVGFMGAAPIGALGMGFLVEVCGARAAMLVPAAAMLAALAATLTRTDIWSFEAAREEIGPSEPRPSRL